ncbi:hypothetical protein D1007_33484 [Hordeum vulgare]|nr:hypothetical protein D1007_33484 [Hordeum vulgare]
MRAASAARMLRRFELPSSYRSTRQQKEAATKAKAARHAKEKERLLHRLSDMRCSSDEDDNDVSTTPNFDDEDNDAPPHADTYTEEGHNGMGDRKGRGRRGNGDFLCTSLFIHISIMLT